MKRFSFVATSVQSLPSTERTYWLSAASTVSHEKERTTSVPRAQNGRPSASSRDAARRSRRPRRGRPPPTGPVPPGRVLVAVALSSRRRRWASWSRRSRWPGTVRPAPDGACPRIAFLGHARRLSPRGSSATATSAGPDSRDVFARLTKIRGPRHERSKSSLEADPRVTASRTSRPPPLGTQRPEQSSRS